MIEPLTSREEMDAQLSRVRDGVDVLPVGGLVLVEWSRAGEVFRSELVHNLITAAGDQMYAARGAGVSSPPAAPTGIRLGTSTAAVAKTGAGAALGAYLPGSNRGFDSGFPTASGGVATFKRTYAAGEATTVTAITEAALVNDTIATDATSPAGNTAARFLLQIPAGKGPADVLTITWVHTILGA